MTFDRARREALIVANADAPLGLDTWSDAMKATAETLARIGADNSSIIVGLLLLNIALTLYGIADPNTYRTRLWQNGADSGFNSDPSIVLYSYANYRPIKTPLVWSQ